MQEGWRPLVLRVAAHDSSFLFFSSIGADGAPDGFVSKFNCAQNRITSTNATFVTEPIPHPIRPGMHSKR